MKPSGEHVGGLSRCGGRRTVFPAFRGLIVSKAELLTAEFEGELPKTRRFIEHVPADRLMWKPHVKSMSAGQLALHIAQIPTIALSMSMTDEAAPPDLSDREQPESLAAVVETLERSVAYVRDTLPGLDDERMSRVFKVVVDGRTMMAVPREAFLRRVMFNHWYHHRGQLGVYIRLLGASVPASYGPSADESVF
jgi:uncharacterized damage-inducible protein DinB